MERPIHPVVDRPRRAVTFMLDSLGLPPEPDDGALAIRVLELEPVPFIMTLLRSTRFRLQGERAGNNTLG